MRNEESFANEVASMQAVAGLPHVAAYICHGTTPLKNQFEEGEMVPFIVMK